MCNGTAFPSAVLGAVMAFGMHASGDPPNDPLPPCAQVEIIDVDCDGTVPPGEGAPSFGLPCQCGPGQWVFVANLGNHLRANPPTDVKLLEGGGFTDSFAYHETRRAHVSPVNCSAHVSGELVVAGAAGAQSRTTHADAGYVHAVEQRWEAAQLNAVPCGRWIRSDAAGAATLDISMTCSAHGGTSASASASLSAACSSKGDANAKIPNQTIAANVGFSEQTQSFGASGHMGAAVVPYQSVGVEGAVSGQGSSTVVGTGSLSASASYAVVENRSYCAYSNKSWRIRQSGSAVANGSGTADSGFTQASCAWEASANTGFVILFAGYVIGVPIPHQAQLP